MDLRQLNALVAVADHGSFSAAARSLHTVQSNISTHVARLERELAAMLVDRSSGALTEEGMVVVARARRIQAELDALAADVASLNAEVTGDVRLGVIGTTARWLVPRLVEEMGRQHPKVQMVVVDATTTSLLPQLESGRLDLAVVNLPIDEPDIETDELFEEDRVLVAPAGHPLFGRDRLTLADLDGEPILLEPRGTNFRDQLEEQAADEGVTLTAQAEVDGMRLLASLAFQGFGAALLPASAAPGFIGGDWKRIPVDGVVGRSVGIARRRKALLSAPARALRDVVFQIVAVHASQQSGVHPAATLPATVTARKDATGQLNQPESPE
ncbi:MAG: LysR family transcriptional regulator [Actinobacteria bacterium]|nr:LysR family transcriptional regulator [Actinomycetota bacterium]